MAKTKVSTSEFLAVYVPGIKKGQSVVDIADELGLEGTDDEKTKYIGQKVNQIRNNIKKVCEEEGKSKKITENYLDAVPMPPRPTVLDMLDDIM